MLGALLDAAAIVAELVSGFVASWEWSGAALAGFASCVVGRNCVSSPGVTSLFADLGASVEVDKTGAGAAMICFVAARSGARATDSACVPWGEAV